MAAAPLQGRASAEAGPGRLCLAYTVSATNHDFAIPGSMTTVLFLPQTTYFIFLAVLPPKLICHNSRIGVSRQYSRRLFSTTNQHPAFPGSTQTPLFRQNYCHVLHLSLLWQKSSRNCTAGFKQFPFCDRILAGFILPRLYFSSFMVESDTVPYCHDCTFLLSWQTY